MLRSSAIAPSLTKFNTKLKNKDKKMPISKLYDPLLSYAQGAWDKMTDEDKTRALHGADERNLSSYDKVPFDSVMEKKQRRKDSDRPSVKVEGIKEDEMKEDFEEMGIPWTEQMAKAEAAEQGRRRSMRFIAKK
jgi:hypothetical protein